MQQITGFIKAVYYFFVGDPIILAGIALLFVVLGVLIKATNRGGNAGPVFAAILIVGVIASLALSLYREIQPKSK